MTTRYCLYSGGIYNEVPYTTLYFAGFLSHSKFNTWRLGGTFQEVRTPPFTLKSTRIYVTSNTQSGSSTWTLYDDGVSTSQTISIPSSTTGAFSVTADAVVADNSICHFRLVNGSSGSLRIGTFTHVVDMTNDDIQGFFGASHQSTGADTSYYSHAGRSLTESYYQFKTPAGTYDNLGLGVYYETGGGTRTHRFRKNGANGNQVISASGTGWYEDVTNSDTVAEGDLVNLMRTTPDANEWRIQHLSVQFTPTSNRAYSAGTYGILVNFNDTRYAPIGYGGSFTSTTTEADAQNIVKEYAQRLRNLRVICSTNTIATSASTCKSRVNGADGNMVISVPAGTTGTYEDTSNTDILNIDDLFCFQYVTPNTSGTIVIIPTLIIDDVQPTPQIVRPDADLSDGNWLNSAGNNTDMYSYIDEASASDADYIESEVSPNNSDCEVTLQNPTDPLVSTGHIVRYRYRRNTTASPINITVYLVQGTTVIASNTHTGVSDTWTDGSFTLSGAEADSITNYSDLRLRFRAHQSSAPANQIVRPDGDISAGGWSPSTGTTLFETIDEVTSSDTDYNTTANNPSADAFTVSLGNPTDPIVHTGHTLNYRYGGSVGARVLEIKVALMQGGTVIHEATHSAVADGFHDGTFTLTTGEAGNITDYNDLRVRVTANVTGGGSPSQGRFAWAELQLPNIGSKGQISWAEFEVPGISTIPVNQTWNLRHDMVGIVNRQWALRHDISAFINRTWNLRHDVFTTVNRIWNIRHDLSQFVNRTWNLRHDLDGIVNRVWNIRHDISQFVNQSWNIRSDISQFVARNWNLRHDVSQFVNQVWNLRSDISQFVNQTWNLRSDVSSLVNRIWNIRYDLSSLVNQTWNLRHDLSSLINRVWNLRHDVASSLTPVNRTWNLRHDLSILVSRSWNLRHDLSSFVAQIWNIRQDISQFVNRQWDIRHDLSEFVAQQWNLRHDIATLVAQTWNLRHDLAGIVNRIWNVRHDISSFVNQNWNIRHDILTLVNRVWSLRHDLSSFVNQTWNLRHDLNQFVNRIWNVRHDLSILVNNSWNLRQDISQFVVGLWNLRHDVSEFVARSWNIRHDLAGIVGNQWNIRHDILSLIGRTWNLRHDLLILVSQNWNLRHDLVEFVSRVWNLRHDLAGTVNQVWNIRHDISVLLARAWTLRHDLSVLVNQGWDLRHDIAQFVSQTWNLRNDLAGAVSRLWNMRHDVISFVNQTWNLRSDILTLVNNTWNIRHDIIQFTSRIWNLRHDLAGTVSETWNLRHDLAHLVAQAWNLRYDLSTFVSGVWNLRHDLLTLVGRTWNLRQDLVSFVNNVWNVRHDISSFINQTWNIRQDISIFVQNSWNLRHDITNLVQNAWNFRHDITSFVSRIWVLRHDISANVTKKTKTIFRSLPKRETLVRGSKKLTSISKRLR